MLQRYMLLVALLALTLPLTSYACDEPLLDADYAVEREFGHWPEERGYALGSNKPLWDPGPTYLVDHICFEMDSPIFENPSEVCFQADPAGQTLDWEEQTHSLWDLWDDAHQCLAASLPSMVAGSMVWDWGTLRIEMGLVPTDDSERWSFEFEWDDLVVGHFIGTGRPNYEDWVEQGSVQDCRDQLVTLGHDPDAIEFELQFTSWRKDRNFPTHEFSHWPSSLPYPFPCPQKTAH